MVDLAAEGFLNKVLYSTISNPAGWVIVLSGLFMFELIFGGLSGTVKIFKQLEKIFIIQKQIANIYNLLKHIFKSIC